MVVKMSYKDLIKNRRINRLWQKKNKKRKRELDKKYYLENRNKRLKYKKERYWKEKKKFQLWFKLNYLERKGIIAKKDICEICSSKENLLKHHPDYNQPLFFVTLCRNCHNKLHNLKND